MVAPDELVRVVGELEQADAHQRVPRQVKRARAIRVLETADILLFLRAIGGRYEALRPGRAAMLNPLQLPDTKANRRFLAEWTERLVRPPSELLDPEDRRVMLLRQWQELEFEAIGEQLGISADAARLRFHRALPKLANKLQQLRSGAAIEDSPNADGPIGPG